MENLLLRYYEGETTEDETALIKEWLEASEENRRTARQIQTLGLAADMAQISSRLDVKKALEDVHRKMKQKKRLPPLTIAAAARSIWIGVI